MATRLKNTARLSRCRRYRYALWRTWDAQRPVVMFIGLNPSTADETTDDPTLVRCMKFARDWGYGGVCMANLFAFRATDPAQMKAAADPVGRRNNFWLRKLAAEAWLVVAAWGNDGSFSERSAAVRRMLPPLHCLQLNRSGEPAHPLYQPARARPVPLPAAQGG
ncbi:MAG: DUF1643 domain-containing protein [Halioglobus sp.]|nr:DUF1643 domain-containing protein [Halioglobus sp.]